MFMQECKVVAGAYVRSTGCIAINDEDTLLHGDFDDENYMK